MLLWEESPGSSKGPGRLGSPDVASVQRLVVLWFLPRCQGPPRCACALACGRPWLIPSPFMLKESSNPREGRFENAKEARKGIKSYGWYSGLCLGATARQVWTARLYNKNI